MRKGVRTTHINTSLSELPSIKGVDWRILVLNVMVTLLMLAFLRIWYLVFISIIVHLLFVYANKVDPFMTRIIGAYRHQGGKYVPVRMFKYKRFDRPNGFGRGSL